MCWIKRFAWMLLWIGMAGETVRGDDALISCPLSPTPVLLDFYSEWCGPCRSMRATVDALSAAGYPVQRVNVDDQPEMARQYRVTSIPCFVVVANGREIDRVTGIATIERLKAKLVGKSDIRNPTSKIGLPHPAWRYERATDHRAAVVRIFCQDGAASRSIGSGTLVRWGGRVVVLTARHVIKDAQRIVVEFCTGRRHAAKVLKADATWDCAVLELVGKPEGILPAEVELGDDAMQREGDRLESCGYGPDGKLACNTGLFLGYRRSTAAPNGPDDWLVISGHARGGDSGGAIFNARGRLVGVLWGTDGKEVVGVQAGRVHALLDAAMEVEARGERQGTGETSRPTSLAVVERTPTPPKCSDCTPPEAESARQSSLGQILGRKPIPSPAQGPTVIVQSDPEVRRSLGNIDAKVGALVEQRQSKTAETNMPSEPSPLVAGLCVLAAVAAGFVIYFGTQN